GKYNTFRGRTYNPLTGKQTGFMDTLVVFTPSDINPDASVFAEQYFNLFPVDFDAGIVPGQVMNFVNLEQNAGLLNGRLPGSVYNLWNNVGGLSNRYSRYQS